MKKIQLDISGIKTQYPRAWKDFEDFYGELKETYSYQETLAFEHYPFEYQLGIFFRFFIDNGMELDVCNIEFEMIPAVIEENFKGHNQSVAHYS
ncbi:MAG TPA: hypothetical protein VK750_08835 [Cytophagaceae bacterium]|jgi:hypothetical protein|nr:hypothetical protein [Cytophagaceae bacterium]